MRRRKNDHSENAQQHRPQDQEDNRIHSGTVNPASTTEEGTMYHRRPRTRALRNDTAHHRARTTARALKTARGLTTAHRAILTTYTLAHTLHWVTTTDAWHTLTTWTTNHWPY